MAPRLVFVKEKIGRLGVVIKRGACSECGWVSDVRPPRLIDEIAENESAHRQFLNHDCDDFPGGPRKWNVRPT
jgi:hypothetical protein